jgi:Flp pilus assembly protein TadG
MFVVVRSPKYVLISLAVTLGIFLIVYFTVISPDQNAANNAVQQGNAALKAGEQQAVNAANQSGVPAGVKNLTACIAAAGSNTAELQACSAKYKP